MTQISNPSIPDSVAARRYLTNALRIDLIGPRPQDAALQDERLPQAPSRWYMTGFLVPTNAPLEQRAQDTEEEFDDPAEPIHGSDDSGTPDRGSGKRNFLPSSIGLSILVDDETNSAWTSRCHGAITPRNPVKSLEPQNLQRQELPLPKTRPVQTVDHPGCAPLPGFAGHGRNVSPYTSRPSTPGCRWHSQVPDSVWA